MNDGDEDPPAGHGSRPRPQRSLMEAGDRPTPDGVTAARRILYVAGWGRSGSTILANLLGEIEGFRSLGELHMLWLRGLVQQRTCGCGARVVDCPFWSEILSSLPERTRKLQPETVVAWQRAEARARHTRRILSKRHREHDETLENLSTVILDVYNTVFDRTGAEVLVDSSKRPSNAAISATLDDLDVFVIHLVRDPRAVAYSWRRHKPSGEGGSFGEMRRYGPMASTAQWLGWNLAADLVVRELGDRAIRLRYEDLVETPQAALRSILNFVGLPDAPLPSTDQGVVQLGVHHTVAGNASRFRTGGVELRPDSEWMERQRRSHRVIATAIASPLLRTYGYPVIARATERNGAG
jgi:hypothetical protein